MANYESYFDIDSKFRPQIDRGQIESDPDLWRQFYPHESFVGLIKATIDVLNRTKQLGVWVEGAYGTGKSHAVLTLKKLLEATPSEAENYFMDEKNAKLLGRDLYNRFDAAKRSGRILTVHRYGSSSIRSDEDLVLAMQESLTNAVEAAGMINPGQSLKNKMIGWLSDEGNAQWMNYRLKSEWRTLFDGRDVTALVDDIRHFEGDNLQMLMSKLMRLPIPAFRLTVEELIAWIKDIIRENDLKTLLFIWDEFTEYFQNNRQSITGFQEIAEISAVEPFYMMIVTHKSGGLFGEGDDSKKILDRFVSPTCKIELPDHMAFKLMARALRLKGARQREWESMLDDLYRHTIDSRGIVMDKANVKDDDLKAILPLHPYTAIILKHISSAYASNQRSMFDFIKSDNDPNTQGFQWFIKTHGPMDGLFMPDMLWAFFYEKGKQNLNDQIRRILSFYDSVENQIEDAGARRVMKSVLMLQAIAESTRNADIFMPTLQNIRMAFDGCEDLTKEVAEQQLNYLVKAQILYIKRAKSATNKNVEVYNARQTALNNDQISTKRDEYLKKVTTESLLPEVTQYDLSWELRNRFKITCVCQTNFKRQFDRLNAEKAQFSNSIELMVVHAKDDNELTVLHQNIREIVRGTGNRMNVVIALSSRPFGADRLEQYVNGMIDSEMSKDKDAIKRFNMDMESIKDNWYKDIREHEFTVYSKESPEGRRINHFGDLQSIELLEIVRRRYEFAPELMFRAHEALWKETNTKTGALCGIKRELTGTFANKNPRLNLQTQLADIWNDPEYWTHNQSSDACRMVAIMKKDVDDLIARKFAANGKVSFEEIFELLERKPYGLYRCNLVYFLFGFILKEYTGLDYGWSNGITSDKLDETKLGISIESFFRNRGNPKAKTEYIVKDKEEIRLFCDATIRAFDVPFSDCNNIDSARASIRDKMKKYYCPIWILKYDLGNIGETDKPAVKDLIDNYTFFANNIANHNAKETDNDLATKIGMQYKDDRTPVENLRNLLGKKENFKKALIAYIAQYHDGELTEIARHIGDEQGKYVERVRSKIANTSEANWLWVPEQLDTCIDDVVREYCVIELSRSFVASNDSFDETMAQWRTKLGTLRIPYSSVVNLVSEDVREVLQLLNAYERDRRWNPQDYVRFIDLMPATTDALLEFFTPGRQFGYFCEINQIERHGLSDADAHKIEAATPESQWKELDARYRANVEAKIEDFKNKSAAGQLATLWKEKAGYTDSPRDWSNKYQMPILAMLDESIRDEAERHFDTINSHTQEPKAVHEAMVFLQNADFFADMADSQKRDACFKEQIIGEFDVLLDDLEEVRTVLTSVTEPSRWFGNPKIRNRIKEMANAKYKSEGVQRAIQQIDELPPADLKKYLKTLISDNMAVGLEIIRKR